MAIRMIATDLDGTLLGRDKQLSARNARALRACRDRGIRLVFASGRSFESVCALTAGLGIDDPIISSNGARADLSRAGGDTILEDFMDPHIARRVFEILKENGIYFVCYARGCVYQNNLNGRFDGRGAEKSFRAGLLPQEIERYALKTVCDEEKTLSEGIARLYKFVAFEDRAEAIDAALRAFAREKIPLSLSSSWFDNIEILSAGANKGRALDLIGAKLGISKDEIMAFGDNTNDRDLLLAAGTPVAMGNAVDELKAIAAHIAPDHDDSGVGRAIEKLVLREEPGCI